MKIEHLIEEHDTDELLPLEFLDDENDSITIYNNTSAFESVNVINGNFIEKNTKAPKTKVISNVENKMRKASGLPYISTNGRFVSGKTFIYITFCCENLCHSKFDKALQESIFQEFYGLADYNKQNAFIQHLIFIKPVARHYTLQNRTLRNNTRKYNLPDEVGNYLTVCKKFFKSLLHVSDGRIDRILKEKRNNFEVADAISGYPNQNRNRSQTIVQDVYNTIQQLPSYTTVIIRQRNQPDLDSLSSGFSVLFKEYCDLTQSPIPEAIFNHICNAVLVSDSWNSSQDNTINESNKEHHELSENSVKEEETINTSSETYHQTNFQQSNQRANHNKLSPETSKKNLRKQQKLSGLSYENTKGKVVPAKVLLTITDCCTQRCHDFFPEELQQKIFKNYYSLGSYNDQTEFLFDQINVIPVARHYKSRDLRQKHKTRKYFLPDKNGCNKSVCKQFFKKVLAVSDGRIDRVVKGSQAPIDKRGQHTPANKTSDEKIDEVNCVIDKYIEDGRNYSNKGKICIRKMYTYYIMNVLSPISEAVFRNIYNLR